MHQKDVLRTNNKMKKEKEKYNKITIKQISGAEAMIHCLLAEGVDLIYGYPGGAIMPVYDESVSYTHLTLPTKRIV